MEYTPKKLTFGDEGKARLIEGIRKLSEAVKSTLGPSGNTVLIESNNHTAGMTVTKDGVTVAKSIDLIDPIENLAVRIMKQAADRTATNAGDGPQPLTAKVMTPDGSILMGDIEVGDVVCGTNGTEQVVTGVFEKGDLDLFEVVFQDGRIVECSGDHIWTVGSNRWSGRKDMTTSEIMGYEHSLFVQREAAEMNDKPLLDIDPFTLGLLIGDGSLSAESTRTSIELSFGVGKKYLIDKIKLPDGLTLSTKFISDKSYYRVKIQGRTHNGLSMHDILDEMGLLGTKSSTKFIPRQYLESSISVRIDLLNGLIATDGYVNKRNRFEFSTISDKLKDDFIELICSLGIPYSYMLHTRENDGDSYSNRSIHRITQLKGYKKGLKISEVRKTERKVPMRCIRVTNDDHLYLTDGFIATHNTTTAIVLTEAIIMSVIQQVEEASDPVSMIEVIRELNLIGEQVIEKISGLSKDVSGEDLLDVATISANNDAVTGKLIADTYMDVGLSNGVVTVGRSQTTETWSEVIDGIRIDRGWSSPMFINDQRRDECVLEDANVLVADIEISNILQLEGVLKNVIQNQKKLIIVAPCSKNVINTLAANVVKNGLKLCVVDPPSFGYRQHELMQDIAISVGATYFSEKTGDDLSIITMDDLGHTTRVVASKDSTILMNGDVDTDAVGARVDELWTQHKELEKKDERDFVLERIASLSGGIGIIHVGGKTDMEQKELFDRVDDAVCAVRAALDDGIVAGGGVTLASIARYNTPMSIAGNAMHEAMLTPMRQIMTNAGLSSSEYYKVLPMCVDMKGMNVKTGEIGDMIEMGVTDPAKVTKEAVKNAISVAGTILSTNAIVTLARSYESSVHGS